MISGEPGKDEKYGKGAVGDYAGNLGSFFPILYDPEANGIIITSSLWEKTQGSFSERIRKVWDSDVTIAGVVDGTTHTFLAGEKYIRLPSGSTRRDKIGTWPDDGSIYNGDHIQSFGRAGGPELPLAYPSARNAWQQFGSWHPGLCQFVLADASVHSVSVEIDEEILRRLCDRADEMPVVIQP